jgi:long-chain acyl-CoA synthetase
MTADPIPPSRASGTFPDRSVTTNVQQRDCASVFADLAAGQPDHIAVIDGEMITTYGELQRMVEGRADTLTRAGLAVGHRVALVAESSTAYLATALAVWRVGGVLVTIYPSSGGEELRYSLQNSDPALLVFGDNIDRSVLTGPLAAWPVTDLDQFEPTSVRQDTIENPTGLREPLSLITFSSGTTSRPKAIMVSANTVLNIAITYGEVWHVGPHDKGIVCLPMAWLYGLASTSLTFLLSGGTVVVLRRARPNLIADAIMRHGATILAGVTTTFAKLTEYAVANDLGRGAFASLRLCISGGEPRNDLAFDRWTELTGVAVLDAYCSSECLPFVTYDPLTDPVPVPGSAGKLVPRSQMRVVDADGNDVAPGEVGEALAAGAGLMLGYWQDDALTSQVMTPDGWYKTKDLVRVDDDGYVYVVGRLSDVIIRGGTNISPAEVERVLQAHPNVSRIAVVGLPDDIYGQRVVAAVVASADLDISDLESYARANLTNFKVPSAFVVVDSLPVSGTTGKVDRRALAEALRHTYAHT